MDPIALVTSNSSRQIRNPVPDKRGHIPPRPQQPPSAKRHRPESVAAPPVRAADPVSADAPIDITTIEDTQPSRAADPAFADALRVAAASGGPIVRADQTFADVLRPMAIKPLSFDEEPGPAPAEPLAKGAVSLRR